MAVPGNAGSGAAAGSGAGVGSRRAAFRGWRRTRPFWGGFLLLLAGIELLLIPLSGIFIHGAVRLVVYIGIGGVFGVLLGALLIACGLLLWLNPAHRTFYAIAGVLLAVLSFIASNLGGFFIGMLLGIIGGSMGFGWTPSADRPARRPLDPPRHGGRVMAAAVLPLLLASTTLAGQTTAHDTTPPRQQNCILWVLPPLARPEPGPRARRHPAGPGRRGHRGHPWIQPGQLLAAGHARRAGLRQPVQAQDRRRSTRRRSIHRDVGHRRGLRHPGRPVVPGHSPGTHG